MAVCLKKVNIENTCSITEYSNAIFKFSVFKMPRTTKSEIENQQILQFFKDNKLNRKLTHQHFQNAGYHRNRINSVIKKYLQPAVNTAKQKPGPKPSSRTNKQVNKIRSYFINHPNNSLRKACIELKITMGTLTRIRAQLGIKSKRRVKVARIRKDDQKKAQTNCRSLYKKSVPSGGNFLFVIDDETYVTLDPKEMPSNEYCSIVPGHTPNAECRIVEKTKFPPKALVWQAITQDGQLSPAFVMQSKKGGLNGEIYRTECLKKILFPWLRSLDTERRFLFWPDKASCHYAHLTTQLLDEEKISYVSRIENPSAVPENRPIERFWRLCKQELVKKNLVAKNLRQFRYNWTVVSKRIAKNHGKALFAHFKNKLLQAANEGPYSVALK